MPPRNSSDRRPTPAPSMRRMNDRRLISDADIDADLAVRRPGRPWPTAADRTTACGTATCRTGRTCGCMPRVERAADQVCQVARAYRTLPEQVLELVAVSIPPGGRIESQDRSCQLVHRPYTARRYIDRRYIRLEERIDKGQMSRPRRDPRQCASAIRVLERQAAAGSGHARCRRAAGRPRARAARLATATSAMTSMIAEHDPDRRCQRQRAALGHGDDGPADAGAERGAEGEHELKRRRAEPLLARLRGLEHDERQHRVGEAHAEAGDGPANAPRRGPACAGSSTSAVMTIPAPMSAAPIVTSARRMPAGRRARLEPRAGRPGHGRRRQRDAAERDAAAAHLDDG